MMTAEQKLDAERQQALFAVDDRWLTQYREEALEPELPFVDPHHQAAVLSAIGV